jgi:uncharacterized membrane protein YphA (DoxX/SURF4 family)
MRDVPAPTAAPGVGLSFELMLPLAVASGLVFVFAVIAFAVVLLVVLFRADDRDQLEEQAEAERARRPS